MAYPYFVAPIPITFSTAPSVNAANPVANLDNNEADLTWRTATGTVSTFMVVTAFTEIDTIALLFSNLRASDTVRLRAYNSIANANAGGATGLVAGSDSGVVAAHTGAAGPSTKTIIRYPAPIASSYWRIDISASGHPDNYIEAARLVMGRALDLGTDVDQRASRYIEDRSIAYQGPGYDDFDEYPALPGWRVTFSWIAEAAWHDVIFPFFLQVGLKKPVLFVPYPDNPQFGQNTIVFGRLRDKIEGEHPIYDGWSCELVIVSIAA